MIITRPIFTPSSAAFGQNQVNVALILPGCDDDPTFIGPNMNVPCDVISHQSGATSQPHNTVREHALQCIAAIHNQGGLGRQRSVIETGMIGDDHDTIGFR